MCILCMCFSFMRPTFSFSFTLSRIMSLHSPVFILLYQLHLRLVAYVSRLIVHSPPFLGSMCILSLLTQWFLFFNMKESISICNSASSSFGHSIIDSRYHSCEMRKVFATIRFPIVLRFSFLHMAIFFLIFFFLVSNFSLSLSALLSISTPRSVKVLTYSNFT